MTMGVPGNNPAISKTGLKEATEALRVSLSNVLGITPAGNMERVAERVIKTYLKAQADFHFNGRMKETTKRIMEMEVGEVIEIEALCKQNLHGQFKTIRKKTLNKDLKYRTEQVRPGLWRIERRPDGTFNLGKSPFRTKKAMFLASIPLDKTELFAGAKEAHEIISCHNKNKARMILDNMDAEWRSKSVSGGVEVKRIR